MSPFWFCEYLWMVWSWGRVPHAEPDLPFRLFPMSLLKQPDTRLYRGCRPLSSMWKFPGTLVIDNKFQLEEYLNRHREAFVHWETHLPRHTYSFLRFLMSTCIQAGYQLLRYSCSFPCYPQAWLPEALSFVVCFILLFCFQTLLPPIKLKWHMVGDDLFSYDRLTALVFKGELTLLGLAVWSSCAASLSVLLKCTWKVSAPWPESPSGWECGKGGLGASHYFSADIAASCLFKINL